MGSVSCEQIVQYCCGLMGKEERSEWKKMRLDRCASIRSRRALHTMSSVDISLKEL